MEAEKKGKEILNRITGDVRGAAAVGAAFLVYYLVIHTIFHAFCPFLIMTGIPCAGCGLTRAAIYLMKGQIARAVCMNPSILLVLIFALYCGYFRYIRGSTVRRLNIVLAVLVAGMLIIYGVRMYLFFPEQAPYVYQSDNLFAAWIPGYQEWIQQLIGEVRAWRL